MKQYSRISRSICAQPWAILPEKMDEILGFIEAKMAGATIDPEVIARISAAAPQPRSAGAVRKNPRMSSTGKAVPPAPIAGEVAWSWKFQVVGSIDGKMNFGSVWKKLLVTVAVDDC